LLSKKLATVCIAVPIGFKPDKLFLISDLAQVNNPVNTCRNVLNLLLNSRENFQRLNTLHNSEATNVDSRDALCKLEKKKTEYEQTQLPTDVGWFIPAFPPISIPQKATEKKSSAWNEFLLTCP